MGRGKKVAAVGDCRCANANAGCNVTGRGKVNQRTRCLAVRYCSQKCQSQHLA